MKNYQYITREYVSPLSLEILGTTADTLQKGHEEAIKAASNLEIEMSKLNLNEAESAWRQQKINEIRDIVEHNTVYGNAYASLDDLITKAGNIASDHGMIGRLKAQQDYETFQKELDNTKEIPEYMKDMFREANPYHYEDTYDEQGNVISGTKWQPNKRYVNTIPINQLMEEAAKLAKPEAGKYSKTRWLDADGNITDDFNKSVTGEYFDITTGKWAELSKDKLKEALETVIRNTPGAIDSLKQDYEYEEWSAGKNNGFNSAIQNKDGQKLNFKEYLNKRFDPFYEAATYRHFESDVEYGKALSAQKELATNTNPYINDDGTPKSPSYVPKDPLRSPDSPMSIDNWLPTESAANITVHKQLLSDMFKKYNPNGNINLDNIDESKLKEQIDKLITDPADKNSALISLQYITDDEEYLDFITEGKDLDDVAGFKLYNAITSFSDLPSFENNEEGKKLKEKYNKLIDARFNNGKATAIRNYFSDDDTYDRVIELIGGQDAIKSLGIKIGNKDGKKYVELPKEKNRAYYTYASAIRNAIKDTHNWFGQNWQNLKEVIQWTEFGDNATYINDDGSENNYYTYNNMKWYDSAFPIIGAAKHIYKGIAGENNPLFPYVPNRSSIVAEEEIVDFVDNLKPAYDSVVDNNKMVIKQQSIAQASPDAAETAELIKRGDKGLGPLLTLNQEEALLAVKSMDPVQQGAYIIEDGVYKKADSKKRMELSNLLKIANTNDLEVSMIPDPKTGKISPRINLKYKEDKEEKSITFLIPEGYKNSTSDKWNQNTSMRAAHKIRLSNASGKPIRVTGYEGFGDLNIKLYPNGDNFILNVDGENIYQIPSELAYHLTDVGLWWTDTFNNRNNPNLNPTSIKNMAATVAKELSFALGGNDATTIEYLTNYLLEQLNK